MTPASGRDSGTGSPSRTARAAVRRALAAIGVALIVPMAGLSSGLLAQAGASDGWRIPASAAAEVNPIAASDAVTAKGKQIFRSKCQRCHGPGGKGDGPEADPDEKPRDLTDPARAARNPDGVVFHKVWNGRKKPKMPAFSTDLSKEEVWTVVHYVKSLRK